MGRAARLRADALALSPPRGAHERVVILVGKPGEVPKSGPPVRRRYDGVEPEAVKRAGERGCLKVQIRVSDG